MGIKIGKHKRQNTQEKISRKVNGHLPYPMINSYFTNTVLRADNHSSSSNTRAKKKGKLKFMNTLSNMLDI